MIKPPCTSIKSDTGGRFIVLNCKDIVILKTISPPSMKDFDSLIKLMHCRELYRRTQRIPHSKPQQATFVFIYHPLVLSRMDRIECHIRHFFQPLSIHRHYTSISTETSSPFQPNLQTSFFLPCESRVDKSTIL
jgi:hypothetical protein